MNKTIIYLAVILAIVIAYYAWSSNDKSSEDKKEEIFVDTERADRIKVLRQNYSQVINNYCGGRTDCLSFGAQLINNIDWNRVYDEEKAGSNAYFMSANSILTSNY